jgi:hypothetical protein
MDVHKKQQCISWLNTSPITAVTWSPMVIAMDTHASTSNSKCERGNFTKPGRKIYQNRRVMGFYCITNANMWLIESEMFESNIWSLFHEMKCE